MSRLASFKKVCGYERALPLWSARLGLIGKADVVEFHGVTPLPVEYKSGRLREFENDDIQLCAQGLCLEEMTGKEVPLGAIYHHGSRRRRVVTFDLSLRKRVETTVAEVRQLLEKKSLPPPVNDHRCGHCSLQGILYACRYRREETSCRIATNFI